MFNFLIMAILSLCWFIQPAFSQEPSTKPGGESHGGDGFSIDGAVKVFDKLEFDNENEFTPEELPVFVSLIRPKLDVLKEKLPSVGAYMEHIFTRGVNPRWYFVNYSLREVNDEGSSPINLAALNFDKVQIAINQGRVVHLQKSIFDTLEQSHQAYLLMHEAAISAIGVTLVKDGSQIRSLAGFLLSNKLGDFTSQEIADEIRALVSEETSKLFIYAGMDSSASENPLSALGWEDHSTLADGNSGSSCISNRDHCVLKNKETGVYWTSTQINQTLDGQSATGLSTWTAADEACKNLDNYGGFSDWRLPYQNELLAFSKQKLKGIIDLLPEFGKIRGVFWSSVALRANAMRMLVVNTQIGSESSLDRNSGQANYRCVRSDVDAKWSNISRDASGQVYSGCTSETDQCIFKQATTGLVWGRGLTGKSGWRSDVTYAVAEKCGNANSTGWGGSRNWRLPSLAEWKEVALDRVSSFFEHFSKEFVGELNTKFWASDSTVDQRYGPNNPTVYYRKQFNPVSGTSYRVSEVVYPQPDSAYLNHIEAAAWLCVYQSYPLTGPDDDRDGVPNEFDKCLNTPKNEAPYLEGSQTGCSKSEVRT